MKLIYNTFSDFLNAFTVYITVLPVIETGLPVAQSTMPTTYTTKLCCLITHAIPQQRISCDESVCVTVSIVKKEKQETDIIVIDYRWLSLIGSHQHVAYTKEFEDSIRIRAWCWDVHHPSAKRVLFIIIIHRAYVIVKHPINYQ